MLVFLCFLESPKKRQEATAANIETRENKSANAPRASYVFGHSWRLCFGGGLGLGGSCKALGGSCVALKGEAKNVDKSSEHRYVQGSGAGLGTSGQPNWLLGGSLPAQVTSCTSGSAFGCHEQLPPGRLRSPTRRRSPWGLCCPLGRCEPMRRRSPSRWCSATWR